MLKYLKLLVYSGLLSLTACGSFHADRELESIGLSLESAKIQFTLKLKHRCDLSNITNRGETQFDFKHSEHPALVIRRRYIRLFRPIPGMTEASRREAILSLLRVRRLNPNQVAIRSEQPICTATQFNLKQNLEAGVLPLQNLLEEGCPTLKNHSVFKDVDSPLEQRLADKIRRDFTKNGLEQVSRSFTANIIDLQIGGSSYLGFAFDLNVSDQQILPKLTSVQEEAFQRRAFDALLLHSEGALCIED